MFCRTFYNVVKLYYEDMNAMYNVNSRIFVDPDGGQKNSVSIYE